MCAFHELAVIAMYMPPWYGATPQPPNLAASMLMHLQSPLCSGCSQHLFHRLRNGVLVWLCFFFQGDQNFNFLHGMKQPYRGFHASRPCLQATSAVLTVRTNNKLIHHYTVLSLEMMFCCPHFFGFLE